MYKSDFIKPLHVNLSLVVLASGVRYTRVGVYFVTVFLEVLSGRSFFTIFQSSDQEIIMSNVLYSFFSIQQILTKMSVVFIQPPKKEPKQEWIYRGEGNANLVISLPDKRQILRIRKTDKPKTFFVWLFNWLSDFLYWDTKNELNVDNQDLKFYKQVMMPLLGQFVCEATPIFMSRKQTHDLNSAIAQCRPGFRKHKKLQFGRATFFTDFAFLPKNLDSFRLSGATYAIEIKPKQGWIPVLSRQTKCQFCQNQYLKLQKGQIKKISGYCPLDLFSGEKPRMIKAIKSLIYNPQNNFKIFRNGVFVYGEQASIDVFYEVMREMLYSDDKMSTYSLLEEFCDILYTTLIKQIDKQYADHKCIELYQTIEPSDKHSATTIAYDPENLSCALPEGCILERILSIQKFDQLGLDRYKELINSYYNDVITEKNYVEKLLKEISVTKCPKCVIRKYISGNLISDDRRKICELDFAPYLVASIANDCSLMLTYRRCSSRDRLVSEEHFLERPTESFVFNVGVFDLYPKPLSTIAKHVKRKLKIESLPFDNVPCNHRIL
ncbi:hypothetical protein Trydic_g11076 [Trypoxylus dichotomus]